MIADAPITGYHPTSSSTWQHGNRSSSASSGCRRGPSSLIHVCVCEGQESFGWVFVPEVAVSLVEDKKVNSSRREGGNGEGETAASSQDHCQKFCSRSTKNPEGGRPRTPLRLLVEARSWPGESAFCRAQSRPAGASSHGRSDNPAGPGAAVDLGVFG